MGHGLLSRMGGDPGGGCLVAPHKTLCGAKCAAAGQESGQAGGFGQQRKEELRAHPSPVGWPPPTLCSGHVSGVSLGVCSGKNMALEGWKLALHLLSPFWLLALGEVTLPLSPDFLLYKSGSWF